MNKIILFSLLMLNLLIIYSCDEQNLLTGSDLEQITADHSNIEDPLQRWQAYDLHNYVIEQQLNCFCLSAGKNFQVWVNNDKISKIIDDATKVPIDSALWPVYKTIDELFAICQSAAADSAFNFQVEYNARFGYPEHISIDYSEQTADDEITYTSKNLLRQSQ